MSFPVQYPRRIGQSAYWSYFGMNLIIATGLFVGGIYAALSGALFTSLLCLLLTLPLSVYFRVIMMRRCRDIGWPSFLPWLLFGMAVLYGLKGSWSLDLAHMFGPRLALAMIDFVFQIVIGCIGSAAVSSGDYGDYDPSFYPEYTPPASGSAFNSAQLRTASARHEDAAESSSDEAARWDAAIARRLAQSGAETMSTAEKPPVAQPRSLPRSAGGFGRKLA
jgi:uncharacterized membrane protein YhaH (DUF805 family)